MPPALSQLTPETIVRQIYDALLGRQPDQEGLEHYEKIISSPNGVAECLLSVICSPEFRERQRGAAREQQFDLHDLEVEKIVFLHLPKTGGTPLHHLLSSGLSKDAVCPERHNGLHAYSGIELAKYRLFSGHYDYPSTCLIPGRRALITMLREPIARLVSLLPFSESAPSGDHRP
jgi:hypothetical protein